MKQVLLRCPVLSLAQTPASLTDRCHSLWSLLPPLAALPSLPQSRYPALLAGCRIRNCATRKHKENCPQGAVLFVWSKWRDSNSRHPAPKAGALPTALHLDKKNIQLRKAGALPVAVPAIFVAAGAASSSADRGHSLPSLYLPPAALGSLPNCATPGYIDNKVYYT